MKFKDILRYTYTSDANDIADKALKSIDILRKNGYNRIEIKNYWLKLDSPYKGINTNIKAPNGQIFEIQYHTRESFELKDSSHALYEKQRDFKDKTSTEYLRLQDEMFALSNALEIPKSIERVRKKR